MKFTVLRKSTSTSVIIVKWKTLWNMFSHSRQSSCVKAFSKKLWRFFFSFYWDSLYSNISTGLLSVEKKVSGCWYVFVCPLRTFSLAVKTQNNGHQWNLQIQEQVLGTLNVRNWPRRVRKLQKLLIPSPLSKRFFFFFFFFMDLKAVIAMKTKFCILINSDPGQMLTVVRAASELGPLEVIFEIKWIFSS